MAVAAASNVVSTCERIGGESQYRAGHYVHSVADGLYSDAAGVTYVEQDTKQSTLPTVNILPQRNAATLPIVGQLITARVTRVSLREVRADILLLHTNPTSSTALSLQSFTPSLTIPLHESLPAILRTRDIRSYDTDNVDPFTSYAVGDVVRAKVISLGDARAYYISTAHNLLGVAIAYSSVGSPMIPTSWEQVQCPVTGQKQARKVAQTIAENDNDQKLTQTQLPSNG